MVEAYDQLQDALNSTDGFPKPPDFVIGPAASELVSMIQDLRIDLACP
ncbi:MAG: hypothetical protein OES46_14915 [Gammaproteobacteria bacterium]|jgi:hypothetical protein|nr:hypothetical protein [Gammaproteobacteria bacterium]